MQHPLLHADQSDKFGEFILFLWLPFLYKQTAQFYEQKTCTCQGVKEKKNIANEVPLSFPFSLCGFLLKTKPYL